MPPPSSDEEDEEEEEDDQEEQEVEEKEEESTTKGGDGDAKVHFEIVSVPKQRVAGMHDWKELVQRYKEKTGKTDAELDEVTLGDLLEELGMSSSADAEKGSFYIAVPLAKQQ